MADRSPPIDRRRGSGRGKPRTRRRDRSSASFRPAVGSSGDRSPDMPKTVSADTRTRTGVDHEQGVLKSSSTA